MLEKHGMKQSSIVSMVIIGLTGGIGSGKSTVAKMFIERNIKVIDADIISREILSIYPKILISIKHEFGKTFIDSLGKLKRRELGDHVFNNEYRRKKLEDIMIPFIKKQIYSRVEQYNKEGEKFCVIDAPTLIEHSINEDMDVNILVWVDKQTQIQRLKQRDSMEEGQIVHRINSQMSLDKKKLYVDFIIDNSKDLSSTSSQFIKIFGAIEGFQKVK